MNSLFDSFNKLNVLIIGDLILDIYIPGKVQRISSEAPIPILEINNKEYRLGGAANVAANIKAMGAEPYLCSIVGNDEASIRFRNLLKEKDLCDSYILNSDNIKTTTKTRFLSQSQQILRVDDEVTDPIDPEDTELLANNIYNLLAEKKIDSIIFEDYDKGIITPKLIRQVVDKAKQNRIPITVDPKIRNFNNYHGVTLFKPNFKEFCDGLQINIDANNIELLSYHAEKLRKELRTDIIMVTLSEKGLFIQDEHNYYTMPTYAKNIYDVSGAGDTVISIASLALTLNLDIYTIALLSNISGGIACETMGVGPINKTQLKERAKPLLLGITDIYGNKMQKLKM